MRNLLIVAAVLVGAGSWLAQTADRMTATPARATGGSNTAASARVSGNAEAAGTRLCDRCGFRFWRGGIGRRRRKFIRHLRHEAAESDQDGGKDHQVTHDATLDTLHSG